MKPTEEKTRENIVQAKNRGEKRITIATWLNVSISTVDKVWRKYKETGSYLPEPYPGGKSKITPEQDEQIRKRIAEDTNITLLGLIDELSLNLTEGGLSKRLDRMGLSYKKRHSTLMAKNARMSSVSEKSGL